MTKAALLIGINYRGTSSQLMGCINDTKHLDEFLGSRGYRSVTILNEESTIRPNRNDILREISNLILSGCKELFLAYSGHGGRLHDLNGDEQDGIDECLVPLDKDYAGYIRDDELRGLFQLLKPEQRLVCLLDCCHSGTGLDLAYNLFVHPRGNNYQMVHDRKMSLTPGKVIMISGCMDHQYSMDAYLDEKFQGALTAMFLEIYGDGISWLDLIKKLRAAMLRLNYNQIPVLSSGRKLNLMNHLTL